MSIEGRFKPRFKGIENFLRRVAFNLGNSPSQTEVKIISCIPIDVSDLQHKIVQLEREAEERKERQQGQTAVVHTALCAPRFAPVPSHQHVPCATPGPAPRQHCPSDHSSSRPNKQSVSFVYPSLEECLSPPQIKVECDPCVNAPNSGEVEHRLGFFKFQKQKKALKRKDKDNTQLVYYAQTSSASPFNGYKMADMIKKVPKDSMSRPYLEEMVRKQYKPDKMVVDMSDTSQFSSPVCRDVHSEYSPCPYETCSTTDMCSCCCGRFQDVDPPRHAHTVFQTNPTTTNTYNANSMYYDTSLYDMVPVRERPTKQKNDDECPKKKKEPKMSRNYGEKVRVKSRFQPYVVNYHNSAMNHKLARRKLPVNSYGKNDKRSKRQLMPPTSTATSNSCSVNCGQVYSRASPTKPVMQRVQPSEKAVLHKNAECLTISLHNTECQTASTKSVQLEPIVPDEDKTEMTLNQIKIILQSVLTEVKNSTQLKNIADDKPKKDAVVQKGPSQGEIQTCSNLLHSYSYSTPYSMNPYAASGSRQMNPSQPRFYPGSHYTPMKCLQNYPLFIQTTGRQCACCYRNIPKVTKSAHTKHAITTATNTESTVVQEHRSKETEKLIKEIYKSLAINMNYPAKDTSSSDYANLRSSDNSRRFEQVTPRPQRKDLAVNCVSKKMQDMSTTPIYTNTTFESNIISNTASIPSHPASKTTTENQRRAERMGYVESQSRQSAYSSRVRGFTGGRHAESEVGRSGTGRGQRAPYLMELPNAATSFSYDSFSSETDSDDTVVPTDQPKKKVRTSIFKKVAMLFKTKPKKKDKEPGSDSERDRDSEASDSDDYQTIDTRSEKRPKQVVFVNKCRPKVKPHSKLSYSKYYMNRDRNEKRRSPNMEQEYRRYFDEKLMFDHRARKPKNSSDLPNSNQSVQPRRKYPVYWQNYEARSVHVDPRRNLKSPVQDNAVESANINQPKATASSKGLAWLKKHKLGIHCGEQWKKLVYEG